MLIPLSARDYWRNHTIPLRVRPTRQRRGLRRLAPLFPIPRTARLDLVVQFQNMGNGSGSEHR